MASRADMNEVVTIEDLLIDEDVWGFWDTREDDKGRPYKGVCFLVDNSRIFLVGADKGAE
jgi:hypothetical protein